MTSVAILGATGYSALELLKILLRHPHVTIVAATSRQEGSPPLGTVHPSLNRRIDLRCEDLSPEEVAKRADCVFACLPHGASAATVAKILAAGKKVVDFSADYRLKDAAQYREWYGETHVHPELLPEAVYGLPELYSEQIRSAKLLANPGCYTTCANLALAPLLKAKLIRTDTIVIDAKSGVSGRRANAEADVPLPECNESLTAYNIGRHRHTPEIEQVCSEAAGAPVSVIFTPHLIPMDRGIFSTIYADPTRTVAEGEVLDVLKSFYADKPFVRVVEHLPGTKDVVDSNYLDVTARVVKGKIILLSVLDNLVKGAAGQAVQNFNLMYGYDETTALR